MCTTTFDFNANNIYTLLAQLLLRVGEDCKAEYYLQINDICEDYSLGNDRLYSFTSLTENDEIEENFDINNDGVFTIDELLIDSQLIDKIFKFASIKHILNNNQNNHDKIFDLLEEIIKDLKNYELELRIEELESKFAKDLSESTFDEIRKLKKSQNIN